MLYTMLKEQKYTVPAYSEQEEWRVVNSLSLQMLNE